MDELMNQRVDTAGIQFYNTDQESILLDIVIENDIFNNYSYISFVDWKIEKTIEAHPKELEFNINKPETGLKKTHFNININENVINDMNDKETVHSSNDLTDDECSNIEEYETQHKVQKKTNDFHTLVDNELQLSSGIENQDEKYD